MATPHAPFDVVEATVADAHRAFRDGRLTARALVQAHLDRIAAYDQAGPAINAILTLVAGALEEADRLDTAFAASGPVGPLHGIPVILKDQVDVAGLPTTLGSVMFEHFRPDRDAFVVERLRQAGAIVLAKATLGELAAGDTHGSLFGSTRNPYDPLRTPGGSSGGPAAAVAASFGMLGIGQEIVASIRRPACWTGLVGMRPTPGLVSRSGAFGGWPGTIGTLGPMARTVADLALMLDALAGYDAEDPATAAGVGHVPASFAQGLDPQALRGKRLGVLRDQMGRDADPGSEDFKEIQRLFDRSLDELRKAGAELVDPIFIPRLKERLATRPGSFHGSEEAFQVYMERNAEPPYRRREEVRDAPGFDALDHRVRARWMPPTDEAGHYRYLRAQESMMFDVLKLMADHRLDAIVHVGVEHSPTLINEGVNPPFVEQKGASQLNTFLSQVPALVVPAGFTEAGLPTGLTFMGRPYDDQGVIGLAYAYEQASRHRRAPGSTPAL